MDSLFFKESNLSGKDIELLFHKDFTYFYNPEEFPLVKFTLTNCQNAQGYDFTWLANDNDSVFIEARKENDETTFEITDISDESLAIKCEKVIKEEMKYREEDLVYLINELLKQQEDQSKIVNNVLKSFSELNKYIEKELQVIDRKMKEANWLSLEKQQFLQGQKSMLEKTLEIIEP